ncbi:MAG: methyl-accepting chemotaxis protein [Candidatus Pelagadaptatus aseana]|uniref:methyl-accepting chemotaxis protein n=1 Tax=Candidatus Pelagadaptatus aseana TaxID=3120508 RepID=UPI0039B17A8F
MQLKVRHKLLLLVGLPLLMGLVIVIWVSHSINQLTTKTTQIAEDRLIPITELTELSDIYSRQVVDLAHKTRAQMLFWGEAKTQIDEARATLDIRWQAFLDRDLSDTEQALIAEHQAAFDSASATIDKLQGFIEEKSSYSMGSFVDLQLYPGVEPMIGLLQQLKSLHKQLALEAQLEAKNLRRQSFIALGAIALLSAIISIGLGWWLVTGINRRVDRMLAVITDVEKNQNLTLRMDMPQGDEFGDMGRRFDRMMVTLSELIGELQGRGDSLEREAMVLAQVNQENETQSSEQKRELERFMDSMGAANDSAQQVITGVADTNRITLDAKDTAAHGNSTVQKTIEAILQVEHIVKSTADSMAELRASSEAIGTVVDVIKSIAEQTNLLALNAAIEAARAGEQGRGFAVVADEVRQLASRTASSTQEIQEIIEKIQAGTQSSSDLMKQAEDATLNSVSQAEQAGAALQQITEIFNTIVGSSGDIQAATEVQIEAFSTMQRNVERVDGLIDMGFDLSVKGARAGNDIAEQSQGMSRQLSVFCV